MSRVNRVIGVVSGKGGVGKSLVTSLLACAVQQAGKQTAILDADITGPSIPRMFGAQEPALGNDEGLLFPAQSQSGVRLMSINLLLDEDTAPVIWRGPVIAGVVKQFWTDVIWGEVDYMFVDMPPGTGDVPLTVFQRLRQGVICIRRKPCGGHRGQAWDPLVGPAAHRSVHCGRLRQGKRPPGIHEGASAGCGCDLGTVNQTIHIVKKGMGKPNPAFPFPF